MLRIRDSVEDPDVPGRLGTVYDIRDGWIFVAFEDGRDGAFKERDLSRQLVLFMGGGEGNGTGTLRQQ